MLKKIIKIILATKTLETLKVILNRYSLKSYSQEGEDMILNRIFEEKKTGFYVDVGAHHPMRFSNTYYFYRKGWNGINIDAMPGSMRLFDELRPRDINVETPVGPEGLRLKFHIFNEPALNGFNVSLSEKRDKEQSQYKIEENVYLETSTLSSILDKHLEEGHVLDFLSIDVEGFEYEVLSSNDWEKYKPKVVLIEALQSSLADIRESDVSKLMKKYGYEFFAKTVNTVFYKLY